MAEGIKISQMQEKANLEGTEYIPIVDGSSNKKVKTDKILTKEEAEENYQEKLTSGTSIKTINNQTVLGSGNIEINVPDTSNLATKTELTNSLSSKLDVTTYNSDKSNFATKDEIPDVSDVLTKTEASDVYQVKGNYLTQSSLDNYITVEDLAAGLEDYAITDEVNIELAKKVDVTTYNSDKANYVTNSDISDMLTKTEANTLYQEKGNYALSTDIPTKVSDLTNDSEYQTATQVDDRIEGIIGSAPEVLDTLTKLAENLGSGDELTTLINEVGNKVDKTTYETDKATFATKTELEDKVDKSTYDFDKTTFATKTELTNKLDTTTYNQDKVNFATKSDLDSYATTSDLVGKLDVSTYNSDKTNFATKSEINNFASKSDLDSKLDASVYNQDKINFATKTELTNYATVSSVESKLDADTYNTEKTTFALKTEIPNTSDMLTKTEAESKYQKIGDYALKSDIPTVPTKVSELVNDSNYQTENEVSSLLENYQEKLVSGTNIKTLNGQDLIGEGNIEIVGSGEGIADAPADSKLYGRKDNNWEEITLPDISEYLTETEANELYQEKGDYAFKSELPTVPTKVSELANDSNYQTANDVNNRVQEIIGSAPEALDTLKEISDALNNDPNFAATITTELSKKVDKIEGKQLSTEDYTTEDKEKLAGIDTSIYAKNEDLVYIADTVIPQMNENTAKALDQKVDWDTEKKVISLPSDGSISALRNSETLEGGVLLAQRTYDEGVTYVTEVGTTKNKLTLNATERPQIDIQGGTSEKIAYESDLRTVPIEVNLPTAVIRGIIKKTYTQEEILGWFGFDEVAKLKSAIVSNGLMYIRYGIQLSGNPYYYRMPVQYCAFESAKQLKIVSIGLDTSNDKPNKITIIFNLDGTLINEVSNVEITFDELSEDIDLTSYLTKDEASSTYQVKGDYALKSEIPDIMSVGMYYPGVKVDSQKLFALTKESTEDDIKAALQIKVASGGYKLPTSEILDDCLGKGYQLLSNWMPVSIAWNGAAYVFYTVGQNYMMKPSGLYTVAISISAEGNYSVFQAGKVEEFALTSNIPEAITKVSELENDSNYQTEEEVNEKISNLGIFEMGNFDSLDAASERACNGGVYDNPNYRFLKFTVNNKKTGLIINNVDDYKTEQYLYYDMYRYNRRFNRVEDTAYVTDWEIDCENTIPGKGVNSSKLFSLTSDSTSEDIQAALTYPNGDGVLTSKDLDSCINNSLLLKDYDTSSLIVVGKTYANSYYTFVYVGFDLVSSPSVGTIKDPNIKSVILNITSAGQYSVFRAATNKEIVTKDWDKLPYESVPSIIYTYSDKIYSEKSILGWFDCDTVEELKEKAKQTVLFNMNYLNSGDKFVRIPVQYIEFKNNDNQIHLSTIGLTIFGEEPVKYSITANLDGTIITGNSNVEIIKENLIPEMIDTPYEINLTNLLNAEDSNAISEAIGGIDNLRNIVHTNRMIVGIINSGSVSVSIRILGQTTTLYYVLDTVAGYTVNEINIINTDGTLSRNIKSHSMMTEEMIVNNLTTDQSTLPLSAAQGKILNDSITDIKKTYIVDFDNTDEAKQIHLEIINKYSEIVTGDNRVPVNDVFIKNKRVLGLSGASNLIPISGARIKSGTVHFFTDFPVQLQWSDLPTNTNFGPIEVYFEADGEAKVITVNTLIDSGGYILNYSNGGLKAKATLKLNDSGSVSLIGHDDEHAISTINLQDIYAKKDEVSNKQDTLVSGTNIKTINGSSLLGEGDINIPTKTSELTNDSNFVTGVGVSKIQVVTELPEVQEDGVLYLVIKSE